MPTLTKGQTVTLQLSEGETVYVSVDTGANAQISTRGVSGSALQDPLTINATKVFGPYTESGSMSITSLNGSTSYTITSSTKVVVAASGDTSGVTDTAAINSAIASFSGGKGRVELLPGAIYYCQGVTLIGGVNIYGVGAEMRLPSGATSSMFVALGDINVPFSIVGLYLSGIHSPTFYGAVNVGGTNVARSTESCIDMSAATSVNAGVIQDCWFEYFDRAYKGASASGTNYDLYTEFRSCRFQFNNVALQYSEHLHLDGCHFYANGTTSGSALNGGGAIYARSNDATIVRCWFHTNYIGIGPNGSAVVNNTQIVGCLFCRQVSADLILGAMNVVSGCAFWGDSAATSYAILVRDSRNMISGNKFNEAGGSYQGACIAMDDVGATKFFYGGAITGNTFYLYDNPSGPAIDFTKMTNGGSGYRGLAISGNTVGTNRTKFISSGTAYNSEITIDGNNIYCAGDYTTATAIALIEMYTSEGNVVSGNMFNADQGATKVNIFGGVLSATNITGNMFRARSGATMNVIKSGATVTGMSAQQNVGFKTYASGTGSISAATSVTINHGLVSTPAIADITLTPQGSTASTGQPYVSSVTSTQIVISVPTSGTLSVGWTAVVYP